MPLLYGEHRGRERLRALIASEGEGLSAADVLVTTGAAGALFIANVGVEAFRTSSFARLLNERKIVEACNSLLRWTKARAGPQGALVVVRGLINRRMAERSLCLGEAWRVEK